MEEKASSSPEPRHLWLIGMALVSELVIFVVAVVPALILTLIQSNYLSDRNQLVFLIASTLLIWWLIQPSIHFQDMLKKQDAEPLRQIVDELSQTAKAKRIHEIVLTDSMNAAAYQTKGFLGVFFVKRTLMVGIPLLRLLNADQLRAVIGHELGHFSQNHGQLGHWLYGVRVKWAHYLSSSFYERTYADAILKPFAQLWVPQFLSKTAQWSRQCEYEADRIAAQTASPISLITGLYKLTAANEFGADSLITVKRLRCIDSAEAPHDYWDWLVDQSSNMQDALYASYQTHQRRRKNKLHDTHPSPEERALALDIKDFSKISNANNFDTGVCAGETFFASAWPTLIRECNQRWNEANTSFWLTWHLQLQQIQAGIAGTDTFNQSWQKERLSPEPLVNPELIDFAKNHPHHALAQFAAGEAFYHRGDDQCLEFFKAALKVDTGFALQASQYMLSYQERFGSEAETSYARGRVEHYLQKARFDGSELWRAMLQGKFTAAAGSAVNILEELVNADPLIDACWVVRLVDEYTALKHASIDVLILRLTTQEVLNRGLTDDDIAVRYAHHLQAISDPNRLCKCMIRYSTEPIHPELMKNLQNLGQDACIKAPTATFDTNPLKFDHP